MAPNRYYSSNAVPTTLAASLSLVSSGTTGSVSLTAVSGYPTQYPFTIDVDLGTATPEVITVTGAPAGSGPYVFPCIRGDDGTTAYAHTTSAAVTHGVSARDFQEPQNHLGATANVHGVSGTLATAFDAAGAAAAAQSAAQTFATSAVAAAALKANNLSDLASASTARTNLGLGSAALQPASAFDAAGAAAAAQSASDPSGTAAAAQAASLQKSANLSDLASAASARTNLGLGTAAVQAAGAFDASGAAAAAAASSLQKSANLSDLASASTARTNLGLGTAATQPSSAFDAAGLAAAAAAASLALPSGTAAAGQVPVATGTGTGTAWGTVSGGGGGAPILTQTAVQTSAYTAAANQLVPVSTASGAVTVTLPSAPAAGTVVGVKLVALGTGNAVTVACGGSDVLNKSGGSTSITLTLLMQGILLQYQSGIWLVLADDLPLGQLDARYASYAQTPAGGSTATVPQGGTGLTAMSIPWGLLAGGTTTAGALQQLGLGIAGQALASAGAGALPAWQYPVNDWFNVANYGALGNGVDQTTAIQAAVTAAVANGGGTVYFPKGTYSVSSAILCGGNMSSGSLAFRGAGWNSQIKLTSGANCFMFDFGTSGGSPQFTPGALFADLYFDCNGANQTSLSGAIYARGSCFSVFDHLSVNNPYSAGILFYQSGTGGYGHHNRVTNCTFQNGNATNSSTAPSTGFAIEFNQSDENSVIGCLFQNNGGNSSSVKAQIYDTNAGHQAIVGCAFVTTSSPSTSVAMIKSDSNPSALQITGCQFDSNTTGNQLELNGPDSTVTGNTFLSFGLTANSAIHISSSYCTITGNTFNPEGTGGTLGFAVVEASSGANNNIIAHNTYNGTYGSNGPVKIFGANSVFLTYPATVPYGGTGLATATAYALVAGGTTSTGALQQVSGAGTSGQVLTSAGAGALPAWQTPVTGFTNPMTTAADLITGGTSGAPQRLGIGTAGQVLTVSSGVPVWQTPSGGGGGGAALDTTATDILPAGVQGAGAVGLASDSGHVHPALGFNPAEYGLVLCDADPNAASGNQILTAGTVYLKKYVIRQPVTLTNIILLVEAAAAGASSGSFAGVYSPSGTRLGVTADLGALTVQAAAVPITGGPLSLVPGTYAFVWLAVVVNYATTQLGLRKMGVSDSSVNNLGTTATTYRSCVNGTGQTSLPSSITPSGNTLTGSFNLWMGGN